MNELAQLDQVAALGHRHEFTVGTGRTVAGVPVSAVLGVQPPRLSYLANHLTQHRQRQVAVVRARIAEDDDGGALIDVVQGQTLELKARTPENSSRRA